MIYNDFKGLRLSSLGLGAMRLPVVQGDDSRIDEEKTAEMVDYAIKNGINYFDTAWPYHSGNSELVMGKILEKYPRDSFFLASKFPGFNLDNMDKVEEIFEKQLEKCRVDYFDFYLFHNVCEKNIDAYLDEKYGIFSYLSEQKKRGRIKHLGFSAHGDMEVLKRFLAAYGKDMEFCQLQVNFIDYSFQRAKEKIALMKENNIPVWVMEPVRGGKLAKLSEKNSAALRALRPDESDAAWALRFVQSLPEVTVTLSGMSDMDQLKENISVFSEKKELSGEEKDVLMKIAGEMLGTVPCTGCKYCISRCPMELNIPKLIELYNEHKFTGGGFMAPMVLSSMPADKQPDACISCRSCEAVCPQEIKISEVLSDFTEILK